jgi:hypothetical protein
MLPVFCSQICLSVLLIGRTESGLTIEPITSALVICQLLTAPVFAWLLEWRSVAKQSGRPILQALATKHHISLSETRMRDHSLHSRTVGSEVCFIQLSHHLPFESKVATRPDEALQMKMGRLDIERYLAAVRASGKQLFDDGR